MEILASLEYPNAYLIYVAQPEAKGIAAEPDVGRAADGKRLEIKHFSGKQLEWYMIGSASLRERKP